MVQTGEEIANFKVPHQKLSPSAFTGNHDLAFVFLTTEMKSKLPLPKLSD